MKKIIILIVAGIMALSGCSAGNNTDTRSTDITAEPTSTESIEGPATPEPSEVPEPTAVEVAQVDVSTLPSGSLNALLAQQDIPSDSTQVILVVVDGNREKMYLMEKQATGIWQVAHGPFEAEIGRNGIGKEKEGDGKSPVGVFDLGYAFGRNGAPQGTVWPWRDTVSGDLWIEDPNSKYYNLFLKEEEVQDKDWKNGSNLNISAYDRAIEVRYNEDRVPKKGSAIFIHVWADSTTSTSGCTAISKTNINTTITWLDPLNHPVFVQTGYDMIGDGDLEYMCDFDYDMITDIKFASDDNFFSQSLPGYNSNTIISSTTIVNKLLDVNKLLKANQMQLIVYDAYRPIAATDYIISWTTSTDDVEDKDKYYPSLDRKALIREYFYIKDMALYPRAQVIHVGLADLDGHPVDMGGEYFIFDETTAYENVKLNSNQEYNRELLHDIMVNVGFEAESSQWWKFAYKANPYGTKYDITIE